MPVASLKIDWMEERMTIEDLAILTANSFAELTARFDEAEEKRSGVGPLFSDLIFS